MRSSVDPATSAVPIALVLACALASAVSGSCAALNLPAGLAGDLNITPPTITFTGATLVSAPSSRKFAAYYCPDLVQAPFGAATVLCQQFFGARPDPVAMTVAFDLHFHIANPNRIPLPLASVLAAATVFPTTGNEKLGAVCLSLCPEGAAGCTGAPQPGACDASTRDVRSLGDFVNVSLPRLIIANGVALATGGAPSFTPPPLVASSEVDITARYGFGPQELLGILRQLATQSAGELKNGRAPTLTIPYRLEGTIWFDAGSVGRIAVGWGPAQGTWTLPIEGLGSSAS